MNEKERLIHVYVNDLTDRISNLKEEGHENGDIYDEVSRIYAVIISSLTRTDSDLTLKEIKPITKVFTDFEKEYLNRR